MSVFLAIGMAVILLPIGAFHLFWATGATWPFRSDEDLARTLIGAPFDMPRFPKMILTVLAGGAIIASGVLPLTVTGVIETGMPESVLRWLLLAQMVVFVLRGSYGYMAWIQSAAPLEPFRTLNRRFYNPLILTIGAACAGLLLLD